MSYEIKRYGDTENVVFLGLNSPWVITGQECRQEIADIGPAEYALFGMTPAQASLAMQGYIRKRRTTVVVTVFNKFLRDTITGTQLAALADPALGVVSIPATDTETFSGYVDSYNYSYNFEGDLVEFSISVMWTYPWALIEALPGT